MDSLLSKNNNQYYTATIGLNGKKLKTRVLNSFM